jgi:hypothetical protein
MDDATRRRLARLVDAIEVGPAPTRDELTRRTSAGAGNDLRPYVVSNNGSSNGRHDPHDPDSGDGGDRRHEIVPTWQSRRPTPAVLIGLAAVIALVLGGLAVRHRGSGPDGSDGRDSVQTDVADTEDTVTREQGGPPPRLMIDPAALGELEPQSTLSVAPLPDDDPGQGSITLYGAAGADQALAEGDLAVAVATDDEVLRLQGEPVTVRGRDGQAAAADDMFIPYLVVDSELPVTWLQWDEGATVTVTLLSRSLSAETLAAVAEGLTVEGSEVRLGAVPDGVGTTEIGRLDRVRFDSMVYASGDATGYSIDYGRPRGGSDFYNGSVLVVSGGPSELVMIRWLAAVTDPVEVHGRPGWTSEWQTPPAAATEQLLWQESDEVIVLVSLTARPDGATLALTDDLVEATDDQWDAIPTEAEVTTTSG